MSIQADLVVLHCPLQISDFGMTREVESKYYKLNWQRHHDPCQVVSSGGHYVQKIHNKK